MNFFSLFKRKIIYSLKKKIDIDKVDFQNKSLDFLFHHYESDKAFIFKKNGKPGHGYSDFYSKELKSLKNKNKKLNILEIGSFGGASAAAFRKYFKDVNVFCFDINISNFNYKSKNIFVYGLDINNKESVDKYLNEVFKINKTGFFDLIVDDGSHNLKDIFLSLKYLFKFLKKNGTYIIEEYKHPNYYNYNRNIEHIFVDEFLKNLKNKKFSESSILDKNDQKYLIDSISGINLYKGNLKDSDICFIKKKN